MARSTICRHRGEDGRVGRLSGTLETGSLLVLVALRAWVSRIRAPNEPVPDWRELMRAAELPEATAARFDTLMGHVRHGMRRALDVRCWTCPRVGADEEAMLHMMAALQAGDRLSALDTLADWLGPDAATQALPGAEAFATALKEEGLVLVAAAPRARPGAGMAASTSERGQPEARLM